MSRFEARVCGKGEVEALQRFLKANWVESHIMANSSDYLDYFFYNEEKKNYNIIYALDKETGEIEGFIAYITSSRYDKAITPAHDFAWLTNWLVTSTARSAGILLFMSVLSNSGCKEIGTVGQNETAEAIYKKMGFKTGALKQYFVLTDKRANSELANGINGDVHTPMFRRISAAQITDIEKYNRLIPWKTAEYIINKYLKSPYYEYYAYGVETGDKLKGAIILRVQEYPGGNRRCLRIMEYFGEPDALKDKKEELQSLLNEHSAEYIDFYCYGFSERILFSSGFEKNEGQILLPNYFEPPVNKNINIRFAYKLARNNVDENGITAVFKGDGDRDFPRTY